MAFDSQIQRRQFGRIILLLLCFGFLHIANTAWADRPFDQMITPVTNPTTFEDPRVRSEIRLLFLYHEMQEGFHTRGGDLQFYLVQARFALNEDFAVMISRLGYIDFNPNAELDSGSGWSDITLGAKGVIHRDRRAGTIATLGLRLDLPAGETDVFQGKGEGGLEPFLSGGWAGRDLNVMYSTGFRIPFEDEDTRFYDFDLHFDVPMGNFYPAFDIGLVHVLDAGDRIAAAADGMDLINFGAVDGDGKTVVTSAFGARYRVDNRFDLGVAYQTPLTSGNESEFLDWRVTSDLIYHIP